MPEFKTNEEYRQFANENLDKVNDLIYRIKIGHDVKVNMNGVETSLTEIEGDYEQCSVYTFSFSDFSTEYVSVGTEELPFEVIPDLSSKLMEKWKSSNTNETYVQWLENWLDIHHKTMAAL